MRRSISHRGLRRAAALAASITLALITGTAVAATPATDAAGTTVRRSNRHGLGVSVGVAGHSGFAYRYFLNASVIQVNAIAMMLDEGGFFAADLGVDYARHLYVWRSARGSWLPKAVAVRAVAGVSGLVLHDDGGSFNDSEAAPLSAEPVGEDDGSKPPPTTAQAAPWNWMLSLSVGLGMELGAVTEPGFSLVLDVRPTYVIDDDGFWGFVTLPFGSAVYNW